MTEIAPKTILKLFENTLLKFLFKLRLHCVKPEHFKISNFAHSLLNKSWKKKITRLATNFGHQNLSSTLNYNEHS